eukprot:g17644.t1
MSAATYRALNEGKSTQFISPLKAAAGLLGLLVMGAAGWANSRAPISETLHNTLFGNQDVKTAVPGPLQGVVPPSSTGPLNVVFVNTGRFNFDQSLDLTAFNQHGLTTKIYNDPSPSVDQVVERAQGYQVVVSHQVPVDVKRLPSSVKLIVEAGTGFNNIDVAEATRRDITVCNVPAYSTDAVAQLAITFVLDLSASISLQAKMLARGDRANFHSWKLPLFELSGKTLGLVCGTGSIGMQTAKLARALGMTVLSTSRSPPKMMGPEAGLYKVVELDELLQKSDFVSVHCPLSDATKHLISADKLSKMKPTAYLINTARGPVVDEAALIDALQRKTIAGAGLDVQAVEPPEQHSPLYTMDNVILTPHIGWKRKESRQRLLGVVLENILAYKAGRPVNEVN